MHGYRGVGLSGKAVKGSVEERCVLGPPSCARSGGKRAGAGAVGVRVGGRWGKGAGGGWWGGPRPGPARTTVVLPAPGLKAEGGGACSRCVLRRSSSWAPSVVSGEVPVAVMTKTKLLSPLSSSKARSSCFLGQWTDPYPPLPPAALCQCFP